MDFPYKNMFLKYLLYFFVLLLAKESSNWFLNDWGYKLKMGIDKLSKLYTGLRGKRYNLDGRTIIYDSDELDDIQF